jgi:hypothetical protein
MVYFLVEQTYWEANYCSRYKQVIIYTMLHVVTSAYFTKSEAFGKGDAMQSTNIHQKHNPSAII